MHGCECTTAWPVVWPLAAVGSFAGTRVRSWRRARLRVSVGLLVGVRASAFPSPGTNTDAGELDTEEWSS